MSKFLVDTSVLIDFSNGKDKLLSPLLKNQKKAKCVLYVNPIIITEYFTSDEFERESLFQKALEFIGIFANSQITKSDGLTAGKLLRKNQVNFLGDALIAANCLNNDFKLVTKNIKHFKNVRGLNIYK